MKTYRGTGSARLQLMGGSESVLALCSTHACSEGVEMDSKVDVDEAKATASQKTGLKSYWCKRGTRSQTAH